MVPPGYQGPEQPDQPIIRRQLREQIGLLLGELTEREATVLRLRYDLDGGGAHTLREIGIVQGVSQERIRQIEGKALRKLRHPCRVLQLADFADDESLFDPAYKERTPRCPNLKQKRTMDRAALMARVLWLDPREVSEAFFAFPQLDRSSGRMLVHGQFHELRARINRAFGVLDRRRRWWSLLRRK